MSLWHGKVLDDFFNLLPHGFKNLQKKSLTGSIFRLFWIKFVPCVFLALTPIPIMFKVIYHRFCCNYFSVSTPKTCLSKSFLKITQASKSSKVPVDPSLFHSALKDDALKSCKESFEMSSQHDAVENLELMLFEFSIDSPSVSGLFDITIIFSRQCGLCNQFSSAENINTFLKIPLRSNIYSSFKTLFSPFFFG